LIRSLSRKLTAEGKYAAVTVSLESFTDPDVDKILPRIVDKIYNESCRSLPQELCPPRIDAFVSNPNNALNSFLAGWAAGIPRPLVLLIDEADAIPGEVLISVLRQLRDGYTSRPAPFPQSVCLVGMRDVRDYRIKVKGRKNSLVEEKLNRKHLTPFAAHHSPLTPFAAAQCIREQSAETCIFLPRFSNPGILNCKSFIC